MPRTALCATCNAELITRDIPELTSKKETLHSGLPFPSNFETSRIRRTLANSLDDLEKYDTEIDKLTSILTALQKQRNSLQEYVNGQRGLLSSIRKVPPEIWIEIFTLYCGEYDLLIDKEANISAPTLTLSSVCSRWRDLAISTPELWSHMSIHLQTTGKGYGVQPLARLFTDRSRPSPLSLKLEARPSWDPEDIEFFELFFGERNRWQHATLNLPYAGYRRTFVTPWHKPHYPLLETLDLVHLPPDVFEDSFGLCASVAPVFHTLNLRNIHNFPDVTFRCSQVTSLSLVGGESLSRIIPRVFQVFDRITHLHLCPEEIEELHIPSENHSNTLNSLSVRIVDSWWSMSAIFFTLRLPSLSTLELVFERSETKERGGLFPVLNPVIGMGGLVESMEDMLLSASHLQTLKIRNPRYIPYVQLLRLFSSTPKLTTLSVNLPDQDFFCKDFLDSLTLTDSQVSPTIHDSREVNKPRVLPCLKDLQLCLVFTPDREELEMPNILECVMTMVQSRRTSHPNLIISNASVGHDANQSLTASDFSELSRLAVHVRIASSRPRSERAWAEEFCTALRQRLRRHIDQGLICTVDSCVYKDRNMGLEA